VADAIHFLGHSTLLIELDGVRILTDPLLRSPVSGLVHRAPPDPSTLGRVDAVVVSHLHHDHLDLPSIRMLPSTTRLLVPRPGAKLLAGANLPEAEELRAFESTTVDTVRIVATPARHFGYRAPFGPFGDSLGFVVEGSRRIYFAGDTDVFPEMDRLGPIDLALLPIAGWGPLLGPGHMNPHQAVRALQRIQPSAVIPIHWGTLVPRGLDRWDWRYLSDPPRRFVALAQQAAPSVRVHVLRAGEALPLRQATAAR
jgi:L-ascorbate metabolism protein UlaG (beta-lactamase superfamily)